LGYEMKTHRAYALLVLALSCGPAHGDGSDQQYVYETYWNLPELSVTQKDTLSKLVEHHAPTNLQPWFFLVVDSGEHFDVTVHFAPEAVGERVWTGKMMRFDSMFLHHGTSLVARLDTYYCVLPPKQQAFTPAPDQLPFRIAGDVPIDELPSLVDFALREISRNPGFSDAMMARLARLPESDDKDAFRALVKQYRCAPIRSIHAKGQKIEISTAVSRRPLSGRGATLHVERKNGEWVVTARSQWIS